MSVSAPCFSASTLVRSFGKSSAMIVMLAMIAMAIVPIRAVAHEVRPAIADIAIDGNRLSLEISILLEAYIAGIDLGTVEDTNESPLSDSYDALRALSPDALADRFRQWWPNMQRGLRIESGGEIVTAELLSVEVGALGNIELARESILRLVAPLPDGEAPVTIGWAPEFGPLALRQVVAEGEDGADVYSAYLTGGATSEAIPRQGVATQSGWSAFLRYVTIGFEHIIPKGLDHILFVLGLFFLSMRLRPLLFQVTAFTLAHTVTLALGILGIVTINPAIVEPLIAASIVYVAVENILSPTMSRWRPAVVFCFGLLHGLGFASVLGDIGVDPGRFVIDLIGFNVGVELGQLTVIAIAFLAVGLWFGGKSWYRSRISNPASAVIGLVGAWWFVERVFL